MKKAPRLTALELLQQKSNAAVNLIRSTIENLKAANSEIDSERANNIAKIADLQTTNDSLDDLKKSNEKVISNFELLLN
jgi:vacuolar-type H+-ATPase subunit D/Vma8